MQLAEMDDKVRFIVAAATLPFSCNGFVRSAGLHAITGRKKRESPPTYPSPTHVISEREDRGTYDPNGQTFMCADGRSLYALVL